MAICAPPSALPTSGEQQKAHAAQAPTFAAPSAKITDNQSHDGALPSNANDPTSGLGQSTASVSDSIPSYGVARAGAVSAIGRHYSNAARQTLNGAAFGSGLKGAERDRLKHSSDPRLKQRIYFYIDNGHGIQPEAGVGGYLHEARLNNLYDPRSKLITPQKDANAVESTVLDAGFDGYTVPDFTTAQGAAVLLGGQHTQVPVAAIGLDINAERFTSFCDTQSELVKKESYENHITGLRPGAGKEILGRIERARDRARQISTEEIRSASEAGVDSGARTDTRGAAAGADVQRSPEGDAPVDPGHHGQDDTGAARGAVRQAAVSPENKDGRGFTGFFSNISLGFKGKPGAKAYTPLLDVTPIAGFVREYNQHLGHFGGHIASSIPGFRELQTIVGSAISQSYQDAEMLDIGASEGALIKAVTKLSGGHQTETSAFR